MWVVAHRVVSAMVLCAVCMHISWAISIAFDPSTLDGTAVHALYRVIPSRWVVATSCAIAAAMAIAGIINRGQYGVLLMIPQQILLLFSAAGAVEAMYLMQYADGVLRPLGFIFGDQIGSVWMAVWHSVAIIAHSARGLDRGRDR